MSRALLLLTAPIWLLPWMLVGLARLCLDGLLFSLDRKEEPSGWARLLLLPVALVAFPVFVTGQTVARFLAYLGTQLRARPRASGAALLLGYLLAAAGLAFVLESAWPWALVAPGLLAVVLLRLPVPDALLGALAAPLAPAAFPLIGLAWLVRELLWGMVLQLGRGTGGARERVAQLALLCTAPVIGVSAGSLLLARQDIRSWDLGPATTGLLQRMAEAADFALPLLAIALPVFLAAVAGLFLLRPPHSRPSSVLSTFVGLRYMRAKRDSNFVSVITFISIAGVTMGVAALTVVLSVMGGFEQDLKDKILGTNSHIVVMNYLGTFEGWRAARDATADVQGITGVTPFIYSQLVVRSDLGNTGAVMKGIDPASVGEVTDLARNLRRGPRGEVGEGYSGADILLAMDEPPPRNTNRVFEDPNRELPGVLIGDEMATTLRVGVGDRVDMVSPNVERGPMGMAMARIVGFRVAGIFHSGMIEYDSAFAYVSLASAQDFLRIGDEITGLEIKVEDIDEAGDISESVAAHLGYPFWTRDWRAMNEPLFLALELEKRVAALVLASIIVVAALNIISTLTMVVLEKGREIAILKAIGSTRAQIMKIFVIEGVIVGFVGTTLGLSLGYALCWLLDRYKFIELDTDVYFVDTLPVLIVPELFGMVALAAMAICFLATLYPSWQAARLDPVEGLRYD